jgi:hypothetical protein
VITVAVAVLGSGAVATAQGVDYGVKGGVHLASLHVDADGDATPLDPRLGLVVGGFMTRRLAGRLSWQPEVLYTQKGASSEQGGGTATQKLDYLDIPVLLSYRVGGGPERQVSAFGGPAVGVRLRARSSASFGGDTLEQDVGGQVERTDLAIVAGAAYQRGRLIVDARYAWGIADIDRDGDDHVAIGTRGVSLMLGWAF